MKEVICYCAECEWNKSIEDSMGRTFYFCMNANSLSFLVEVGTNGYCTLVEEDSNDDF